MVLPYPRVELLECKNGSGPNISSNQPSKDKTSQSRLPYHNDTMKLPQCIVRSSNQWNTHHCDGL